MELEEVIESDKASLEDMADRVLHSYLSRLMRVCDRGSGADELKNYIALYDDVLSLAQGIRDLESEDGYESTSCEDDDDDDF